jgi:predicted protein tyrosine phosphatase
MNVLFVCAQAIARSPVAAILFRQLAGADTPHQARVAGTAPWALTRLTTRDLAWADLVAVMEETHRQQIRALWPDHAHKMVVLGVPDDFEPGDPELRATLAPKIRVILEGVLRP